MDEETTITEQDPNEFKYEAKQYSLQITFPDPEILSGSDFNLYRKALEQTNDKGGNIRLMFYAGIRTCMAWKVPAKIFKKEIRNGEEVLEELSWKHLLAWEDKPSQENFRLVAWFARVFDKYITRKWLNPNE